MQGEGRIKVLGIEGKEIRDRIEILEEQEYRENCWFPHIVLGPELPVQEDEARQADALRAQVA